VAQHRRLREPWSDVDVGRYRAQVVDTHPLPHRHGDRAAPAECREAGTEEIRAVVERRAEGDEQHRLARRRPLGIVRTP
jgi:hypothetical protein